MSSKCGFLFLILLIAIPTWADAPGVFAITGGTVHPVSGPEIANGTVIIRDGLIDAVGANIAIPPDATQIDAKGGHIYPGLIDAHTSLGFPSAAPRRSGLGAAAAAPAARAPAPAQPDVSPAFLSVREAKFTEDDMDAKRATGVTTIGAAPSNGIFNGQFAVFNLAEGTNESRVIRAPAAQQISFSPRSAWTFPDSLMGVVAHIRQTFMDAQQYSAARAIYDRNPTGYKRPEDNPSLQALDVVMRREVPVLFVADSESMMRRAQQLAREFNIRYILSGARQGYQMAGDLKGVPVLVSVRWPVAPATREDRDEQPLRLIRDRQLAPTTPSVLAKSGVLFALVSGASGKTSEFLSGIRKAIDSGLSADDAVRAVTLSPARILGIDRQLGSLERGKIANVVISDKAIFTKDAKVMRIYVDGREVRLPSEEERAKRGATTGEAATGPLDGTWSITVKTSQGDANITATLHADNGNVTGSFSGDRGSGDIRGGTFDGTALQFTIAAQAQTETIDWVFSGTVRDGTMSGTVSTNLGTFPFSGSKSR